MTLGEQLIDHYGDHAEDVLLADGFEGAFMGLAEIHTLPPRACYDRDKCIKILFHQFVGAYKEEHGQGVFMLPKSLLMEGEATSDAKIDQIWDEAVEYFEFNVAGAYVGESTPTFLTILPDTEWQEGFQSRY
jgi:hypothetical protein